MPETSSSQRIFSHLTNEERIDQACELLAVGVLRLAQERGLLRDPKDDHGQSLEASHVIPLHLEDDSIRLKEAA